MYRIMEVIGPPNPELAEKLSPTRFKRLLQQDPGKKSKPWSNVLPIATSPHGVFEFCIFLKCFHLSPSICSISQFQSLI